MTLNRDIHSYKVAFFDLDGTLLDSSGSATPGSKEAVEFLRANGIHICLATGRASFGAQSTVDYLKIEDPCVFFSGGVVSNPADGTVLFQAVLDPKDLRIMTAICRETGIYQELYTADEYFIEKKGWLTDMHAPYLGKDPVVCDFNGFLKTSPVVKATLVAQGPDQEAALLRLKEELPHLNCGIAPGATAPVFFANFTHPSASRENGFHTVLRDLEASPEEAMAFGDADSDIPFLKMSGLGIALGNAEDAVKMAADYVTTPVNEDGVLAAVNALFRS